MIMQRKNNIMCLFHIIFKLKYCFACLILIKKSAKKAINVEKLAAYKPIFLINKLLIPILITAAIIVVTILFFVSPEI